MDQTRLEGDAALAKFNETQLRFVKDVSLFNELNQLQQRSQQLKDSLLQQKMYYNTRVKDLKLKYQMAPVELDPDWVEMERQGQKRLREEPRPPAVKSVRFLTQYLIFNYLFYNY